MTDNDKVKNLIGIFLSELRDDKQIKDLVSEDKNLRLLVDCYNRYSVKSGLLQAIEYDDEIGELKKRLHDVPINELKIMIFKYAGLKDKYKLIRSNQAKENFKHLMITAGFVLFALISLTIVGALIFRENQGRDLGLVTEVIDTVVEVFKILTTL